jgi:uncharacterized iron-regulated membrane protein
MSLSRLNRRIHYWGAIVCALPLLLVIGTGILLQLKKQLVWVQPATMQGTKAGGPELPFATILQNVKNVPEAGISSWEDIDRLDVRPDKGIIKVQGRNHWEIQLDQRTGAVLQSVYRRSDLIESLHDGSFFSDGVKMGIFLPSALLLFVLWVTGLWLFMQPLLVKWRRRRRVLHP